MFLASSVSNLITVTGAVDYFMEISKVPNRFAIALVESEQDVIEEYLEECENVSNYNVINTYNITYENKLLKGDMDRAFEVMENLLENAFKYGDGKRITIDFYEEDYCQVIRVFNTGATVPFAEMPHLFDSFFRGSNVADKPGNGLGLYICKQIMNKMDGEIFAERKEDGMSFGVVFR